MEQYHRNWKNYYAILELNISAEPDVITSAYRRLAQKYHPDATQDIVASVKMVELNEAYEVLSSPTRRAAYDSLFREKHQQQPQRPTRTDYSSKKKETPEPPIQKQDEKTLICNKIITLLTNQPGLKAQQIADILTLKRDQVYFLLFNELRFQVTNDRQYRWSLKEASGPKKEAERPTTARQAKAETKREGLTLVRDGLLMILGGGAFMAIIYVVFGGLGIGWIAMIFVIAGIVNLLRGLLKS